MTDTAQHPVGCRCDRHVIAPTPDPLNRAQQKILAAWQHKVDALEVSAADAERRYNEALGRRRTALTATMRGSPSTYEALGAAEDADVMENFDDALATYERALGRLTTARLARDHAVRAAGVTYADNAEAS